MDSGKKKEGGGNAPLRIGGGVIGGSTGGASVADLARGYTKPGEAETGPDSGFMDSTPMQPEAEPGFLDRPHGWER